MKSSASFSMSAATAVATVAAIFTLSLGACSKDAQYWYPYQAPVKNRQLTYSHQVTSLVGWSAVDILWVIDNSYSMDDDQAAVIRNTDMFMNQFIQNNGLKWRMGLVSTDIKDEPYVGFRAGDMLEAGTLDPIRIFQRAVGRLGTQGDPTERAFEPMQKAFKNFPQWSRPDALLAVIVLTDEDEQSSSLTPARFYQSLKVLKNNRVDQIATYLVTTTEDTYGCTPNETVHRTLPIYRDWAKVSASRVYSLLCPSFGDNLAKLGQDIMQRTTSPRIPLDERPIPASIRVSYKGKNIPGGPKEQGGFWVYDYRANALMFSDLSFVDADNASVDVSLTADDGWE